MHASVVFIDAQKVEGMTEFVSLGLQWFQLLRMCFSYRYCSWCNGGMLWCLVAAKPKPWDQILTVLNLYHTSFVVQFWNMDFLTYKDRKGEVASIPHAWSTWPPKQRRLGLFGHNPTSYCRPSLSCPVHSLAASIHGAVHPRTGWNNLL